MTAEVAVDELPVNDRLRPCRWQGDYLELLDQRCLPFEYSHIRCTSAAEVAAAIRDMVVRGAPAIAFAGAWGMVLAAQENPAKANLQAANDLLLASRPTAVNLRWALERLQRTWQWPCGKDHSQAELVTMLTQQAEQLEAHDLAGNRKMAALALPLLRQGNTGAILTHCNTGALATAGLGTALGAIRYAHASGLISQVYADETRPWLQGARLTAWELLEDGVPVALLADSAAASLLASGKVGWVVVGADRVCANGDVVNKIGTYMLALAAKYHGVGFMVVAHSDTLDTTTASGGDVVIEQRPASEVLSLGGKRVAAEKANAWNPSFDVTPACLINALVTEQGVIQSLAELSTTTINQQIKQLRAAR